MSNQGQSEISIEVPNATDWESYTPTLNSTTGVASSAAKWRRVGDSMEIAGYVQYNGTGTATVFTFSIPAGVTIDLAKTPAPSDAIGENFGYWGWFNNAGAVTSQGGYVYYSNSTSVTLLRSDNNNVVTSDIFAAADRVTFKAILPISGWTATSTQSFTSTDLVPAKAVLGNTTLTIPAITDWVSYTPVMTHDTGAISNATASAKWRREGSDVIVTGSITFGAASAAFSGIYLSLPSGYTIDSSKLIFPGTSYPVLGQSQILDPGFAFFSGLARYSSASTVKVDVNATVVHTGNAATNVIAITNAYPTAFNIGDSISFEFRFPAVGLAATTEVVVSGTQAALVQDADSMIRLYNF
jgi:hypothetical protein